MTAISLPFVLVLALLSSCIELEISAPSFPDIMNQLQVSETMVGLTITYNLVGIFIASLIYGPVSEYYGRRRIMLIGNAILAIGAMGCVLTPSIEWLLVSRFIQGFGAATSAVIVSVIISDVYTTDRAAKLYGVMNAVFTIFMALAPVLGGFINASIGWRGNYGIVAVLCAISWLVLFFFLPETRPINEKIAKEELEGGDSEKPTNKRSPSRGTGLSKVIRDYKRLLTSFLFMSTATVPSLLYGCYMTFVAIAPFIYMKAFNFAIMTYTIHQGIILSSFAIMSQFSGKITEWLGVRKTISMSLGLYGFGATLMLFPNTAYILTFAMTLLSTSAAFLYPIVFARSIEVFPDIKGTASSAIMSLRYLLCSGITGMGSYLYDGKPIMLGIVVFCVTIVIITLTVNIQKRLGDVDEISHSPAT